MNLNIKTTNTSLTPAIKDYLEKKVMMLDKIVDFSRDDVLVQVELGKTTHHHHKGDVFRAEINLSIGGHFFRAVSEMDDLYAAIDDVKDQLSQEVKSSKAKHKTELRHGSQEIKEILKAGEQVSEPEDLYSDDDVSH